MVIADDLEERFDTGEDEIRRDRGGLSKREEGMIAGFLDVRVARVESFEKDREYFFLFRVDICTSSKGSQC